MPTSSGSSSVYRSKKIPKKAEGVIDTSFAVKLQAHTEEELSKVKKELDVISERVLSWHNTHGKSPEPEFLHEIMDLEKYRKECEKKKSRLETKLFGPKGGGVSVLCGVLRRTGQKLSGTSTLSSLQKQQFQKVVQFHVRDKSEPVFVDREMCQKCSKRMVVSSAESAHLCPSCGDMRHIIMSVSDYMEGPELVQTTYERSPLYRKYLRQFQEGSSIPPPDVIKKVCLEMSKIHMMLPSKVRPTPIAHILRNNNMQRWVPYAVRIAKHINNEPVVVLSQHMIERLVSRFEKVSKAFSNSDMKDRKKIMNFEFLTRQFLFMEKRPDLAELFSCHKTRTVLKQADRRLTVCSRKLKGTDDLEWNVTRNC